MKKKFCVSLILLILIISEISTVYADIIIPGQHFNEYTGVEKLGGFIKFVDSPIIEITSVVLVLFIVIALVLLTLKKIETKENKNKKAKSGLQKIFLGISVILDLLSIYILKLTLLFSSSFGGGSMVDEEMREITINKIIPILYIAYAISLITSFTISSKKNNKKMLYLITTAVIIAIFILCIFIILNTDAGYYTYDRNSLFPF